MVFRFVLTNIFCRLSSHMKLISASSFHFLFISSLGYDVLLFVFMMIHAFCSFHWQNLVLKQDWFPLLQWSSYQAARPSSDTRPRDGVRRSRGCLAGWRRPQGSAAMECNPEEEEHCKEGPWPSATQFSFTDPSNGHQFNWSKLLCWPSHWSTTSSLSWFCYVSSPWHCWLPACLTSRLMWRDMMLLYVFFSPRFPWGEMLFCGSVVLLHSNDGVASIWIAIISGSWWGY